jgi:hypothetical protein
MNRLNPTAAASHDPLGRGSFVRSVMTFGVILGALAAVAFQFVYIPLTNDLRLTAAFFWGIFLLLFEVPGGAAVGAFVAFIVAWVNAVLPSTTPSAYRVLAACLVAGVTFAAVVYAAELIVPGESGFTLAFYASVVVGVGLSFGLHTWLYLRRHG